MSRVIEVVYLVWVDSETQDGWLPAASEQHQFDEIHSVGLLIHSDPQAYHLAISYDPGCDHVNPVMRIPAGCVRRIVPLGVLPLAQGGPAPFASLPKDSGKSASKSTEAKSEEP